MQDDRRCMGHFSIWATALVNGWDNAAKLVWLPVRLTGKAQVAWKRLTADARGSYDTAKLATALVNGWDNAAKLVWLPVRLTGKAQVAWKRLTADARGSYDTAKHIEKLAVKRITRYSVIA